MEAPSYSGLEASTWTGVSWLLHAVFTGAGGNACKHDHAMFTYVEMTWPLHAGTSRRRDGGNACMHTCPCCGYAGPLGLQHRSQRPVNEEHLRNTAVQMLAAWCALTHVATYLHNGAVVVVFVIPDNPGGGRGHLCLGSSHGDSNGRPQPSRGRPPRCRLS